MKADSPSQLADSSNLPAAERASTHAGSRSDSGWMLVHSDWLRRLIERRVQPLDCGDEVLQEVSFAGRQSSTIPSEPPEREPWLARVAISQCALALRSWCRRRRRETEYVAARELDGDPLANDPIYGLLLSERREFVREQLGRLDPVLKELLMLKYVAGHSYKDIAKRLNMDVATVEYRLSQARKMLRRRLVEAGLGEDGYHA